MKNINEMMANGLGFPPGDLFPLCILFFPDNKNSIILITQKKLHYLLASRVGHDLKFKKLLIELQEMGSRSLPSKWFFFLYHSTDVQNNWMSGDFTTCLRKPKF